MSAAMPSEDVVRADTQRWLERAVIGLNLCPFAKGVVAKGQLHVAVSDARDEDAVQARLRDEIRDLLALDAQVRDTTLLVLPLALPDFLDFNDFLDRADAVLDELDAVGELQIASFHPDYQFAGTDPDDVTNCSNRAPYPMLHLLREDSVERAVQAFPDASDIFERNMATLEKLGAEGWAALGVGATKESP
ncbi:hypothetical protein GCM10007320_12330 [Pseudorhodoferax aquiterrae]|uniref:DUF1415 domain-containing protein n=2 Tax=Pseudorhodoferax aquiterrae TaxID=747304 RepID=A0ABQ3FXG7_9BURK|nr:hypothetical protein GCM10007320_12330 [Pseudorhodoferax aquiterrae]